MDCVASYALNRRMNGSIIAKDVLKQDMMSNAYNNLDNISDKIKW